MALNNCHNFDKLILEIVVYYKTGRSPVPYFILSIVEGLFWCWAGPKMVLNNLPGSSPAPVKSRKIIFILTL